MTKKRRDHTHHQTNGDHATISLLLARIGVIYPHTCTPIAPRGTRIKTRPDTRLPGGHALAWRYDTTLTLSHYAHTLITQRRLTATDINTWDTHALIGLHLNHAHWWSKHPHRDTLIKDLTLIHTNGTNIVDPPENRPLVGEHPDCGGTIRANPGTTPLTATCNNCHQTLNITWWAKLLPTTGLAPLSGLIIPIALQGHTVTVDHLRRLADRGILQHAHQDDKGRRIFDVPTTVTAYLQHKANKRKTPTC